MDWPKPMKLEGSGLTRGAAAILGAKRLYWGNDRLVLLEHALREEAR